MGVDLYTVLLNTQYRIVNLQYSMSSTGKAIGSSASVVFNNDNVFIVSKCEFPSELPGIANEFIQIALQPVQQPHARSGVNLMTGAVRIAVYRKALLDLWPNEADRIASGYGVLYILKDLYRWMPENYLQGCLVRSLQIDTGSVMSGMPQELSNGWITGYVDFTFAIASNVPSLAVMPDGTTADRGQP